MERRFADMMEEQTTCEGCGGPCKNGSGFCRDCQSPDWDERRREAQRSGEVFEGFRGDER